MALSTTRGEGKCYFVQVAQDTDGTFIDATSADVFGDTAGTVHVMGTQEDSTPSRDDKGATKVDFTVFETDVDRLNMLELVAPPSSTSASDAEEVTLEDGTKYGGAANTGDSTKPYFVFFWLLNELAGKMRCRVFVGQFDRQGGLQGLKGNQRNRLKFTVNSVDGQGFTPTLPGTSEFTGMTAPALSGSFIYGKVIEAT